MPTCQQRVFTSSSVNSSSQFEQDIYPVRHANRSDISLPIMPESDRVQQAEGFPTVISVCNALIFFIVLIAQVVVGAVYSSDCPRQPLIPVYLIVMGGGILLFWCCGKCNMIFCYVISLFYFCWFIAGNVWIYSIYEPNYNKSSTQVSPYCNKTLYLFAFWTTNLTYILLGVILFSWCLCRQQQPDDDDTQRLLQG